MQIQANSPLLPKQINTYKSHIIYGITGLLLLSLLIYTMITLFTKLEEKQKLIDQLQYSIKQLNETLNNQLLIVEHNVERLEVNIIEIQNQTQKTSYLVDNINSDLLIVNKDTQKALNICSSVNTIEVPVTSHPILFSLTAILIQGPGDYPITLPFLDSDIVELQLYVVIRGGSGSFSSSQAYQEFVLKINTTNGIMFRLLGMNGYNVPYLDVNTDNFNIPMPIDGKLTIYNERTKCTDPCNSQGELYLLGYKKLLKYI